MAGESSLELRRDGPVATIALKPLRSTIAAGKKVEPHAELGRVLTELRADRGVRVIVLTGAEDGEFGVSPPSSLYDTSEGRRRVVEPDSAWDVFMGGIATHQLMIEIEKPIVARVNGDCIGYAQSLMLACDLIVAREDARISDVHLAMGQVTDRDGVPVAARFGLVPGDGAGSLLPLYLTPTRAKEYLMLSPVWTAAELARIGVINRAVPVSLLDATVDEFVQGLLARPAHALQWTKRLVNRHVAAQFNLTMDASAAYEMITFLQAELASRPPARGGSGS